MTTLAKVDVTIDRLDFFSKTIKPWKKENINIDMAVVVSTARK